MALKEYKATSAGIRFRMAQDTSELAGDQKAPKALLRVLPNRVGRNNNGRITSRHRGGGHKRMYRVIDFNRRERTGIEGIVESIQYDPFRSVRAALIKYSDGERRYIPAPLYLKVGFKIMAGTGADIRPGNALPLNDIPLGTMVHCIELKVGKGGQIVRTAGGSAQLLAKDKGYVQLKLPSGEIRLVRGECYATVGQLGNLEHENVSIGKAGRTRWMRKRPHVRGTAMNPVDHPHGGGEGRTKGGRHPVSPWGTPTKGYRTRHRKSTSKYILQRRK